VDIIGTAIPHAEFGDPECCGCLNGIITGDTAEIVCNECNAIVRRVPASELRVVLSEMELVLDVASSSCPHCGAVNLFPGFTKMHAFTCRECGEPSNG
jgi:hypothetical protein